MIDHRPDRLAEHIAASLDAMFPATAARLLDPNKAQRMAAIEIMARTLAARLDRDRNSRSEAEARLPGLPLDLR